MSLLIHTCCGPCLLYPSMVLKNKDVDFTAYFYNPNIHPYKEFKNRLDALSELCKTRNIDLIVERDYGLKDFLRSVVFKEKSRCPICYSMRMKKTAQIAHERGFSSFSTTLLYSKYQNHTLIKEQCSGIEKNFKVPFYYQDFRIGWERGIEESKQIDIYRQKYCGCIYSEQERFDNRYKKKLMKQRKTNV